MKDLFLLLFDLYWLRFKKPGDQWYELTDYLRDKLIEDGYKIKYTKDDLIFNNISMKNTLKKEFNER
jgi:hypothetical protein